MNRDQYRVYLQSAMWLQRRERAVERAGQCQRCGLSRYQSREVYHQDLEVHHRNYKHVGCELDEDLEVLCQRCHEAATFGTLRGLLELIGFTPSNLPAPEDAKK
jgi:5-methylcytosine-specific restriction endonuclease McrA